MLLSGCGFLPYRSVRLALSFLMALRTMARKFLSRGVSLGCISSSSSSVGMMRFSSPPFVGDFYIHLGVYLFFDWIQVSGRGGCPLTSQRRSTDVKLTSWNWAHTSHCWEEQVTRDPILSFLEAGQEGRHDFVRPPEKTLIATHLPWFYLQFLSVRKPGCQRLGTQLSPSLGLCYIYREAWINGLSFFLPIGGDRIQNSGQRHN